MGWRKSVERTAAFFFTEHQNSYASRTGRPNDVGVIGVAGFRERAQTVSRRDSAIARGQPAPQAESAAPPAPAHMPAEVGASTADDAARQERSTSAPQQSAKLGTGHGRDEGSRVRWVQFERASEAP